MRHGNRHAVGAASDAVKLGEQRIEHHGDRKVEHREKDGAITDKKSADHRSRHPRNNHRQHQQDAKIRYAAPREESHAIGADGKEHGMTDGD